MHCNTDDEIFGGVIQGRLFLGELVAIEFRKHLNLGCDHLPNLYGMKRMNNLPILQLSQRISYTYPRLCATEHPGSHRQKLLETQKAASRSSYRVVLTGTGILERSNSPQHPGGVDCGTQS